MLGISLMGKMLIAMGMILIFLGIILTVGYKIPWIGRLPGDILIKKDHFSFYFPLASCAIASIIISLVLHLFRR